jgi:hypothetical protein
MALTKEKIANWIRSNISNDPTRYEYICSDVTVTNFKQIDNQLEVEYSFWDDCSFDNSIKDNFLFDVYSGKDYGVNFPKNFVLLSFKDVYTWPTASECEQLTENLSDVDEEILDEKNYTWDDPETAQFIEVYISDLDKESMAEMLIEEYNADKGLPSFIPACLVPHFQKILADYSK